MGLRMLLSLCLLGLLDQTWFAAAVPIDAFVRHTAISSPRLQPDGERTDSKYHPKAGVVPELVQANAQQHIVRTVIGLVCVLLFVLCVGYWVQKYFEDDESLKERARSLIRRQRQRDTPSCVSCLPVAQSWSGPGRPEEPQSKSQSSKAKASNEKASPLELWTRIIAIYVACIMAPGVLKIWSVVQPLFAEAGVFGSSCGAEGYGCESQESMLSFTYLMAFAIMLAFTWPVGLAFDWLGPKTSSAVGAFTCCCAQMCVALAIQFPRQVSWLLFFGALFADVGGMMNGFALFGFLWHDPERQGFITGLSDSSSAAGTLVALIVVTAIPFKAAVCFMINTSAIAAFICWRLAPSLEEYNAEAAKIWNIEGLKAYGKQFGFRAAWKLAWRAFKDKALGPRPEAGGTRYFTSKLQKCWKIFTVNYTDNMYFTVSLVALLSFYCYFTSMQSPYLIELFDSKQASVQVCDFGASVYGIAGLLLGPASGWISDRFGIKVLIVMVAILNMVQVMCVFVPTVPAQMLGSVAGAAFAALYITYGTRWFVLYAPPDQFGNFSGCIFSVCGLLSMVLCAVMYWLAKMFLTGLVFYVVPLAMLGLFCVISTNSFIWHIHGVDLQGAPPIIDDQQDDCS